VKAFVTERLAEEKVPTRVLISDDVPRTATCKIQRRIVAEFYIKEITKGQPKARL
jgi:acyl-coenzyme A synthetase/AMP-(fatty) acid ligase